MEDTKTDTGGQAKRDLFIKVPAILAIFWIVKLLTTAMGEAFADFLQFASRDGSGPSGMGMNGPPAMGMGASSAIGTLPTLSTIDIVAIIALAAALILQFRTRTYVAWIYWLAVSMVSITGTILADSLQRTLGGQFYASVIFAAILIAIFAAWYISEKTLSIHSIYTKRREAFYWAVVIVAFTLGTALGDWTADSLGLGYLGSIGLFAVLFAIPFVACRFGLLNSIAAFWFAYVMTRPLGASVADWLDSGISRGGLGVGTLTVSLISIILITGLVIYLSYTKIDVPTRVEETEKESASEVSPQAS